MARSHDDSGNYTNEFINAFRVEAPSRPQRCRAVVVTVDGKRYLTPWRATALGAITSAERLAERKGLQVARIDGMVKQQRMKDEQ